MKIRVLLVEDDPMVAYLHEKAIEKLVPFQVAGIAKNGNQAVELTKTLKPDLLILDVFMPELDGVATLKKIREEGVPVDAIMVTAATESTTIEEAIRYGAVDYIIKPFKLERLDEALIAYANKKSVLVATREFDQDDLDKLLRSKASTKKTTELPKGLTQYTLEKIQDILMVKEEGMSAEDVGSEIGVSRITARRYLEYLVEQGSCQVELCYGLGRPVRKYTLVT